MSRLCRVTPAAVQGPGRWPALTRGLAIAALSGGALSGGCALFEVPEWARQQQPAVPVLPEEHPPLRTDRFVLEPDTDVVGEMQVIRARHEDTFVDIARAYDLGYDELIQANPGVDPWLPGAGTPIVLPTQFVLPEGPRQGIVLNIGTKRIFYFPKAAAGKRPVVITHPVGIGREGWATPVGSTRIVAKVKDPVWTVPASIRREHAEAGDPLPARVPPGPDNPLGRHALRLGFPSYLIHGTNKPSGIGMRVSHGCIQLFPEDIESLFDQVAVGTSVRIVNQPQLLGWRDGNLYLEAHPPLADDRRDWNNTVDRQMRRLLAKHPGAPRVDPVLLASIRDEARGFPLPVLQPAADAPSVIARARPVRNVLADEAAADGGPVPVAIK